MLIPIGVVGIPNTRLFAMSSRWMQTGFNDTLHITLTSVFGVLVAVPLVLSAVARRAGGRRAAERTWRGTRAGTS